MTFEKHELQTIRRALAIAGVDATRKLRAAKKRAIDNRKTRPGVAAGWAMASAEYMMLFERLDKELGNTRDGK